MAEIRVHLIITKFNCSGSDISRILDICPTETWRKGDPVAPNAWILCKDDRWMFTSPVVDETNDFTEQVHALLSAIEDRAHKFKGLPKDVEISIYCAVDDCRIITDAKFTREQIALLANIGASIEFDVTTYEDDNEEEE